MTRHWADHCPAAVEGDVMHCDVPADSDCSVCAPCIACGQGPHAPYPGHEYQSARDWHVALAARTR